MIRGENIKKGEENKEKKLGRVRGRRMAGERGGRTGERAGAPGEIGGLG
jgi:hypothetical protein